ncbi:MarR family winged helix-turn-helix transcriptional regulator [Frigoribacterium sp. VKM Ac-1396]|uniref:MarR family winged helix-turn-helix transcriptional regulator n=1 Tax=Frigoribacterium sp. VKM Ac-1396 TaxID=2783821 RepID=UPI00351C5E1B
MTDIDPRERADGPERPEPPERDDRSDRDDRTRARRDGRELPADDIRARVQQVAVRQQRFERHLAERLGVDRAGLDAMDHLITTGPATPSELARRVEVSTAAMTLVLNRLESAGHVRRERHPSDGRKLVVTAEQASADRAYEQVLPMIDGIERLVEGMDDTERAIVQRFLDRLIGVYDDATP